MDFEISVFLPTTSCRVQDHGCFPQALLWGYLLTAKFLTGIRMVSKAEGKRVRLCDVFLWQVKNKNKWYLTLATRQASRRKTLSLIRYKTPSLITRKSQWCIQSVHHNDLRYSPVFTIQPVASVRQDANSKRGFLPVIPQSPKHFHHPSHRFD